MDQVFCSESLVIDQRSVLEQIEQELATISRLCPDGEKTFERLLQLLDKLVAADADTGSGRSESDDDTQSDTLSQVILQLRHQLEEAKAQIRQSHQQLAEAEDENHKLLTENSEQTRLIQSLKRQFETLQHQCDDQTIQLTERLQSEQSKTQRLEQSIVTLKQQVRSNHHWRKPPEIKSLADEMREVLVEAGIQTVPVTQRSVGQQTTEIIIRKLEVVHIENESTIQSEKQPVLITGLQSVRLFLILLIYLSYEVYALLPLICDNDYILCPPSVRPPL